jgi:two-component system, NtrC family, nitrogen regulation sensor histidine kinase NtrY
MAFKRRAWRAVGQILLFGCGAGVVLAWQAGFYACVCVLILAGLWLGVLATLSEPSGAKRAAPEPELTDPLSVQAEQRLLASLLDQSPAPLVALHPDGVIRAVNRAARTLFRTDDRLVSPQPELLDALRGGGGRLTVALETETGPRTYAVAMTDLAGPRGAMRLAALQDIQPEIRAAEAAALRDLLQVLGHEIMNALTPIASLAATASDLISDQTPASTEQARDAIATLARRAEGLARFVEAYRTLARLPPPRLAPTSLNALLAETARVFDSRWAAGGVRLDLCLLDPDATLRLDLDLMVHALMNILSNGAEAVADAPGEARYVRLSALPAEGGASLTIEDNGSGVSPADHDRVFQPFFTTKAEGTGVGLSFARQVVLAHGGELTLAPQRPGVGATFLLTL